MYISNLGYAVFMKRVHEGHNGARALRLKLNVLAILRPTVNFFSLKLTKKFMVSFFLSTTGVTLTAFKPES